MFKKFSTKQLTLKKEPLFYYKDKALKNKLFKNDFFY